MKGFREFCKDATSRFGANRNGAAAILFSIAMPFLIMMGGGAMDYNAIEGARQRAKAISDAAALAIAREMTVVSLSPDRIQSIAETYVSSNARGDRFPIKSIAGTLGADGQTAEVRVVSAVVLPIGILDKFTAVPDVTTISIARAGQQTKLCLLSLNEVKSILGFTVPLNATTGINLMTNSRLTSNGCVVHTNVATSQAVRILAGAQIKSDVICAVGGIVNSGGSVSGDLINGCPKLANPLDGKPFPGGTALCTHLGNLNYNSGDIVMMPGSYCGKVLITGTAKVKMSPGIYVFRNQLMVAGDAELRGTGVGMFFSGLNSYFKFLDNALIDISAPDSGPMAGMLLWEGADLALVDKLANLSNFHQIKSNRAKRLTGTIYLPAGRLLIDSTQPVAENSEFTVLVVNQLDLQDGPNLVLNSNYSGTTVPVPKGLGPLGSKNIKLEK